MSTGNNRLSVIIPSYNRQDSLRILLTQLSQQHGITPEILVIDQNPAGYLDALIAEFPGVKQVRLPHPNVSAARNEGYRVATGDFLLFLDDDLRPEPDFCAMGMTIFSKYPDVNCFAPLVYNAAGKDITFQQHLAKRIHTLNNNPEVFSITDTLSAAIFFRKPYYALAGGFDPVLFEFARAAEDQELFFRMRKKNLILYFVPFIEIFHDESVPGGCDMRTSDYWITREKCIRAWVYRHRMHNDVPGRLSPLDYLQLFHSTFFNKEVLLSGIGNINRQVKLLSKALRSTKEFLKDKIGKIPPVTQISFV